jgi:hypothetical protein
MNISEWFFLAAHLLAVNLAKRKLECAIQNNALYIASDQYRGWLSSETAYFPAQNVNISLRSFPNWFLALRGARPNVD